MAQSKGSGSINQNMGRVRCKLLEGRERCLILCASNARHTVEAKEMFVELNVVLDREGPSSGLLPWLHPSPQ